MSDEVEARNEFAGIVIADRVSVRIGEATVWRNGRVSKLWVTVDFDDGGVDTFVDYGTAHEWDMRPEDLSDMTDEQLLAMIEERGLT